MEISDFGLLKALIGSVSESSSHILTNLGDTLLRDRESSSKIETTRLSSGQALGKYQLFIIKYALIVSDILGGVIVAPLITMKRATRDVI
ncbi:MAG: hypothetical protein PVG14_05985 [Anaerolineales bacterium]|jgi:hypothetical protein